MEIGVIIILVVIVIMATTNLLNIFDSIVIADLFLRLFNFILLFFAGNELIDKVNNFVPNSLLEPINQWTSGTAYIILIGIYIVCYGAFLYTTIKRFIKKR